MPMYTGKSADGSDMQEVQGMYLSADGNHWKSEPFTKEEEKMLRKEANKKKWDKLIASKF